MLVLLPFWNSKGEVKHMDTGPEALDDWHEVGQLSQSRKWLIMTAQPHLRHKIKSMRCLGSDMNMVCLQYIADVLHPYISSQDL